MSAAHSKNPARSVIRNAAVVRDQHVLVARCTVYELSAGGARLRIEGDAQVPDKFTLWLASNGAVRRDCRVVWREKGEIGIQFQSSVGSDQPPLDRRLTA